MTGLLNSTNLTTISGFRLTPIERSAGRVLRAPDHDAGDPPADPAPADPVAADPALPADPADPPVDLASATAGDPPADPAADPATPADPAAAPEPVVPDTYELKLTTTNEAGEEIATDLDPALVEAATPLLKDVGLTNEAANKLLPLVPKIQERIIAQQVETFETTKADWAKETQADPELGGKNWKETAALVGKALDHFAGGPDKNEDGSFKSGFRQLLVDTGLTNHPEMARMLRKIGAAAAEDGTFVRSETKAVRKSPEEENYPDDVPKK